MPAGRARLAVLALAILALAAPAAPAQAAPVLLISIDGLRPGEVLEADRRGLKLPNLRRFVAEGSYASAVVGVLPTVTYPSHTTLLTGASPAKHGIVGNTSFDPLQINQGGWFWYAGDIRLPTLWQAVRSAGGTTANVHWPVSVGASDIRWNLPQIWRTGHGDDAKLFAALATPGLLPELEQSLGPYAAGVDESIAGDEIRGRFAARLITDKKPVFTTVYLTALDREQHGEGPGTPKAHAILERIDAIVGQLIAAERAAHPDSVIAVVSDHGFTSTRTEINFFRAFIDAGFITLGDDGKIAGWTAMPWNSGGSVAVVVARRDDPQLIGRVSALLRKLKADPAMRIAAIADRARIREMGGNPQAEFYVDLAPDATGGSFKGRAAALAAPTKTKGMHGYFPRSGELASTFMLMGAGVPRARNLGEIDMRAIAPTLAALLEVPLPTAELPPIALAPEPR